MWYAVKLVCSSRGDTGLAQGLDEVGCASKTPLLLEEKGGGEGGWGGVGSLRVGPLEGRSLRVEPLEGRSLEDH